MESSGSRKVKCRWDSLPDVSPNKYIKYNEGSEPRCSVGNSQDERCVSGSNSLLKTCEEKQTALDLTNAFVEGKSGMQIETCAHPRNIARSVVTTKAWNLKRAVAPPRRILFHKPQYHSQPTQPVPYRSVPSFSEMKPESEPCSKADSNILSRVEHQDGSEDCSLRERRQSMTNRGSPMLFARALQDAIGSPFNNRVKRTESTQGRERPLLPRTSLDHPGDACCRKFTSVSSGDGQKTDQGVSAKWVARNACSNKIAENTSQPNTDVYAMSEELHNGYGDCFRANRTVVYPTARKSDIIAYVSRQRVHDSAVLPPRLSRHSDPTSYRTSRKDCNNDRSCTAVYPVSKENCNSVQKAGGHNADTIIPSPMGNRRSDTGISAIATETRHGNVPHNPLKSDDHHDMDVQLSGNQGSISKLSTPLSVHDSVNRGGTVQTRSVNSVSTTSHSLRNRELAMSDPICHPPYKELSPLARDHRHILTGVHPTSLGSHSPPNQTLNSSWCGQSGVNSTSMEVSPRNTTLYPQSRERPSTSSNVSFAPNESLHLAMVMCQAAVKGPPTAAVEQGGVDGDCGGGTASRLVFLHEHDSDDRNRSTAQEPDLSEGSDFSDVDDVIPFAKLSQDEFIQANNIEKEAVTPIMYPQPLIRNSWSDYTRYGTSTPVRAQSTTRSLLNGASFKNVFSRNSTSNASPSYNYSALSEGSCCGANSISDSWISEDKSKSFIEEPSFHISEAHSPDHLLQESEMKESPATLPRWMSEGFIDTHCHLDMLYAKLSYTGSFAKFRQVYSSTFSKQFQGCIADFCNPRATKKFPWEDILRDDMVWGAFGCHPHFARFYNEFHERELLQAMRHPKTIAFGEMGLDYSHKCTTEVSVQHKVFERQLQLAVGLRKPLVIHCRDADEDLLEIMKKAVPRDYKIHRHCFTGSFKVIEPFLEAFPNMAVGFTAVLTYPSANDVKDAVKKIPLERIIVETDAPYFLPRQVHKRVCQFAHPGHAIHTVNEIARIKELPPTSVMAVVRQNTNQLYNL
ncbi:putative deoxyribonuclease TATDN2 isoform X1 [Ambystoma mexicanum]|uniref:putative deoxyribonuclease TATDN2 isoform X1 n=1 Tax=Ambystoma mexicanum TaxID=8296 RepID=UPI0037E726EF